MPKFIVDIERITSEVRTFEVEASEIWAAEEKALAEAVEASDWDDSCNPEYNIMFSQTKDE